MDPTKFLHEQLAMAFSLTASPVWMDSSTSEECKLLEETAGSPEVRKLNRNNKLSSVFSRRITVFFSQKLAEITGSRAYERFSGAQIAKISRKRPEAYSSTEVLPAKHLRLPWKIKRTTLNRGTRDGLVWR